MLGVVPSIQLSFTYIVAGITREASKQPVILFVTSSEVFAFEIYEFIFNSVIASIYEYCDMHLCRSPGGTPLKAKSRMQSQSSQDPADVIANALRKKFAKARKSIGSPITGNASLFLSLCFLSAIPIKVRLRRSIAERPFVL